MCVNFSRKCIIFIDDSWLLAARNYQLLSRQRAVTRLRYIRLSKMPILCVVHTLHQKKLDPLAMAELLHYTTLRREVLRKSETLDVSKIDTLKKAFKAGDFEPE